MLFSSPCVVLIFCGLIMLIHRSMTINRRAICLATFGWYIPRDLAWTLHMSTPSLPVAGFPLPTAKTWIEAMFFLLFPIILMCWRRKRRFSRWNEITVKRQRWAVWNLKTQTIQNAATQYVSSWDWVKGRNAVILHFWMRRFWMTLVTAQSVDVPAEDENSGRVRYIWMKGYHSYAPLSNSLRCSSPTKRGSKRLNVTAEMCLISDFRSFCTQVTGRSFMKLPCVGLSEEHERNKDIRHLS